MGISFLYPDSWKIEEEVAGDSVTVESSEGAFVSISRSPNLEDLQGALQAAQATMQEEYEEVERESCNLTIADQPLEGVILRFVFIDLIVCSQLLAFTHAGATYLVQIQAEDRDFDRLQPVFEAILTSLCQNLADTAG
ncbi:MAG: hypothetical protein KDA45_04030 [Planctomycetales bacterium]|nr:hypothetical protein [Planctomycetales bacterium]